MVSVTEQDPRFITVQRAAELLRCSYQRTLNLFARGVLKGERRGDRVLIDRRDIARVRQIVHGDA